jgi:hypothetical protein
MKKQLVSIGIITTFFIMGFSGCTETNEPDNENAVTPAIMMFSVNPYSIQEGNTAELSWNVINASLVTIDTGIGNVSLAGNRIITPLVTTNYTLTARYGDKETHASCQIIVTKIDYELRLVGTWNKTLGEWYYQKTLVFYPDKTARFGEMDSFWTGGWSEWGDYDYWSVNNGTLITRQFISHEGKNWYEYLNYTIRFDGDTLILVNQFDITGEGRYKKIS